MERYFFIAGAVVKITGEDKEMFKESGVLKNFEVKAQKCDYEIECKVVDKLPTPEGPPVFEDFSRRIFVNETETISYIGAVAKTIAGAFACVIRKEMKSTALFLSSALGEEISAKAVLNVLEPEHLAVLRGGFILHASCIEYQGRAIVFTAPSGSGKSTQANLWNLHRDAQIINGDRIMICPSKNECMIRGIPFCGSSGIREHKSLPLAAIISLEKAPVTSLTKLHGVKAFQKLWEGCTLQVWNREDVARCMEAVECVVNQEILYHLACTPDISAITAVESVL